MQPTHFLYFIIPPRPSFVFDARPEELEIMGRHADYLRGHAATGLVLMAGPTLDGAYGASVLATGDQAVAEAVMAGDPAVTSGLMQGRLHPWRVGIFAENKTAATLR